LDGAWLTLISIPNSLGLLEPLTVVPTSHLYLHGRGQRKSIAGLTPHLSASGVLSIFYTRPNIHRFLHLPRGLVYIYSRPNSSFDRVTWGKRRIPSYNVTPTLTRPSRWRPVRSSTPILTSALTYVYSHIPSSKNNILKNFCALSECPRGSTPGSPDSSPRATSPGIFYRLYLKINKRFYSGTPKLQRHPYSKNAFGSPSTGYVPQDLFPPLNLDCNISFYSGTPTSNVTPTPKQYSDPPPRLTYLTIFCRRSTSILNKIYSGTPKLQRHPYTNTTVGSPPRVTHPGSFPVSLPPT